MPMYLIWIVIVATLLAGIILFLHRSQQQNRRDVVERSTPLAIPDVLLPPQVADKAPAAVPRAMPHGRDTVPDGLLPPTTRTQPAAAPDIPTLADSSTGGNWLGQIKRLREKGDADGALQLSQAHFPRMQAFQQAAIILRQQVRELVEQHRPVHAELKLLYRTAVFADLYRSSNPYKPRDPESAYLAIATREIDYQRHGTRQLRLLTKSDIRHLEQLWGRPQSHLHAEEVFGEQWQQLCR